ncbi:MAG: hypothetical protein ABI594_13535 [Ginsengibacter sp.]
MRPYIRIAFITFTVWLLAAFVNGLLCGIFLAITEHHPSAWAGYLIGIFFISLFFSAPGFFIFWIIMMVTFAKWTRERALFRTALSTGFILSATTGICCSEIFSYEFHEKYVLVLLIILSAITSVMLHFKHFIKIN